LHCEHPVSLVDVVPTILKMTGVRTDAKFDGIDLTMAWLSPDELGKTRYLFGEADHNNWIESQGKRAKYADVAWMVRVKNDKLHYNEILNRYELYDLSKDPFEQKDIAGSSPDRVEFLRATLTEYIRNEGSGSRIEPPDEAELNKLRALGYVDD
jgi:arylsulfatase A-like enzyme